MSKRTVAVLLFGLLFPLLVAIDVNVGATRASGTIYIRADGSIDPPTAPTQRNDDVYTLTGNVTSDADGIVVGRDNIVVDGSGYTVEGMEAVSPSGIHLYGRSNVTIRNTNIKNFYDGIMLESSSNNSIDRNNITNTYYDGILLTDSSNNSINGNDISNNGDYGVRLIWKSDNNSISGNNIITNNNVGIQLSDSSNNTLYHNNLINNTVQVNNGTPEYANFWDNGCEGNYWSNYNGFDGNQDGIGEVQYLISENDTDHYPLMNIYWNPCDINHDLEVNRTDIDISARAFDIRAGDALWNPHADITGPEPLIPDGKVDMRDISLIAKHFGEHYP